MSNIGDIKQGKEIDKTSNHKFMWIACPDCGRERWVQLRKGIPGWQLCLSCSARVNGPRRQGKANPNWKGGRQKNKDGYILVWLANDNFFYPMVHKEGYVLEHRLVVAKALGRNLHSWEIIHHKEGFARDDNRYPETLQLVSDLGHKQITLFENRIKRLEMKVEEQAKLLRLLQWQEKGEVKKLINC